MLTIAYLLAGPVAHNAHCNLAALRNELHSDLHPVSRLGITSQVKDDGIGKTNMQIRKTRKRLHPQSPGVISQAPVITGLLLCTSNMSHVGLQKIDLNRFLLYSLL